MMKSPLAKAGADFTSERIKELEIAKTIGIQACDLLKERIKELEDALYKIDNWAKAYPLKIFPEPDFKRAAEVLKAAGLTLDAISASNMRHVIKGVKNIVEQALKGGEDEISISKAGADFTSERIKELEAENNKLREILTREVDDGRAEVDDIGIKAWIEQALKGRE